MITNSGIGYNGRLGNQLFQFAALFGVSKESGNPFILPARNLSKRNQTFQNGDNKSVWFCLPEIFPKLKSFIHDFDPGDGSFRGVQERSFKHDPEILKSCIGDFNVDLHGYFQSPKYFEEYYDDLLDVLQFKRIYQFHRTTPLVSIHVRRGDYLALTNNHPPCSKDYYDEAIAHFDGCKFMVFSDDIPWCKENFPGNEDGFYFSEDDTEGNDLMKMRYCDHHIIANSSFSWWGAYLNPNKTKEIIAPKKWFGPSYDYHDTSDLLSIATKLL